MTAKIGSLKLQIAPDNTEPLTQNGVEEVSDATHYFSILNLKYRIKKYNIHILHSVEKLIIIVFI